MGRVKVDVSVLPEEHERETAGHRYRAIKPTIRFQSAGLIEPEFDRCPEETDEDVPQHQDAVQLRSPRDR